MTIKKRTLVISTVIVVIAVAATIALVFTKQQHSDTSIDTSALNDLPTKDNSTVDVSHLDPKLVAPTNSWLSGMVLQKDPKAVFPLPLSFKPSNNGFSYSLPQVTTTAKLITAPHSPAVELSIDDATAYALTRYDKLSGTLTYRSGDAKLATTTLSEGSPYIFTTALSDINLTVKNANNATLDGSGYARFKVGTSDYVIYAGQGARITKQDASLRISAPKNSIVTAYALASGADDPLKPYASNVLESVSVNHSNSSLKSTTTFTLKTRNNQPTVYGSLPHQNVNGNDQLDTNYATLYGQMKLYATREISYDVPLVEHSNELDMSAISSDQKRLLGEQLNKDVASLTITKDDTYFGGKELYKAANLLSVAHQIDDTQSTKAAQAKLKVGLEQWLTDNKNLTRTKRYFYYDPSLASVVGETAAFGSEDANDHHFHYGYFIYAASILAKYDSEFASEYGSQVNVLVADIASPSGSSKLPQLRNYDPYMGHSWAAGLAPFDDGNNQESSSEAINAWNAFAMWADTTRNNSLNNQAAWMLSNEIHSAESYWTGFDRSQAPYKSFDYSVIALNWGGKREYNTFFSPEPNAMLGIQLIPMNPTMKKLPTDHARIVTNISGAIKNDNYDVQFGDYILMYESLVNREKAFEGAQKLPDANIDDSNTRTYMYAWILSR